MYPRVPSLHVPINMASVTADAAIIALLYAEIICKRDDCSSEASKKVGNQTHSYNKLYEFKIWTNTRPVCCIIYKLWRLCV